MSRTTKLSLAAASFALLAGCAHVNEQAQTEQTAAIASHPNVINAQRLVSGLKSLIDVTERMKDSKLRPPQELCVGTILQADLLSGRALEAMNFYNGAPEPNALYVSNLQKRVTNIDMVFSDLTRLCPNEAKALGVPAKLELQVIPASKKLRLAVTR